MSQLRTELAVLFNKSVEDIHPIKCKEGLYDPVDGLMIISEKNRNDSNEDLRTISERYEDVKDRILNISYGGQGSRPDGPEIARVYQTEVDKQNRVAHGQQRLTVTA